MIAGGASDFSKKKTLVSFACVRRTYSSRGEVRQMIGIRFWSRGTGAYYRVRVPAMAHEAVNPAAWPG